MFLGDLADAVTMTERFVDRVVSLKKWNQFRGRLTHAGYRFEGWPLSPVACAVSSTSQLWRAAGRITGIVTAGNRSLTTDLEQSQSERTRCADLLRDIFPFRPVPFDPSWLTPIVTTLAQQMYDVRDFSAMPVLADALQDAGCADDQILDHCRGPGPHVRGCWAIDGCLGTSPG
jgi:hypothetical protein